MQRRARAAQKPNGCIKCVHTRRALRTTKPTNTSYTVRTPQNDSKKADLPARSSKPRTEEPHRFGNHVDASGGRARAHSARIDKKSAAKTAKNISITQSKAKLLQLTYWPIELARMAWGTTPMHRPHARMCRAFQRTQKRLKPQAEISVYIRRGQ